MHRRSRASLSIASIAGVFALVASILLTPTAAASASNDPAKGSTVSTVDLPAQPGYTVRQFKSDNLADTLNLRVRRAGLSTQDDPPAECTPRHYLETTATYYNKVLEKTESSASSYINCTVTAPGQTMRHMVTTLDIRLNGTVYSADANQCSKENADQPPCVDVSLGIGWLCGFPRSCSGEYVALHTFSMLLPEGWEWQNPPQGCFLLGPPEIHCSWPTESIIVPPLIP
jgi:hypothetical protein